MVYAELNGTHALSERVRLLGHLGWLRRGDSSELAYGLERQCFDLRTGLGITLAGFDLQLAGVLTQGDGGGYSVYSVGRPADRSGWVLSLTRSW